MIHSFDTILAEKIGLTESIVLNQIQLWINYNRSNEENFYKGKYWTYNSISNMTKYFIYLSESEIRRALSNLESLNLIETDTFSYGRYNRTKWYTLTNLGVNYLKLNFLDSATHSKCSVSATEPVLSDQQNYINNINSKQVVAIDESISTERTSGLPKASVSQLIQDTIQGKTQLALDVKRYRDIINTVISELNRQADKHFKNNVSDDRFKEIVDRLNDGYTLDDLLHVIKVKSLHWKDEPKMNQFLRPITLFGEKFEDYLNEKIIEEPKWKKTGLKSESEYNSLFPAGNKFSTVEQHQKNLEEHNRRKQDPNAQVF